MLRRLHSSAGFALALLLLVIASTGVILSFEPAANRLAYPSVAPGPSVAVLADGVAARHARVDSIRMRGDGALTATYNDGAGKKVEAVDPGTGAGLGPYQTSKFFRFVVDLHRSLLMADAGRIAVAIAALGMLTLCVTGAALLARSLGGASALLRPIRGDAARRWHGELGRLALVGLMLSSLTAAFLAATTFGVIPIPETELPAIAASGGPAAPIRGLAALAEADVADLKQLTFPVRDGASGVFRLRTSLGEALVDPSTGSTLAFAATTAIERIGEWAQFLHTGQGAWVLALALGLTTAAVPALGATGFVMWLRRRSARPGLAANAPMGSADTIILVGRLRPDASWRANGAGAPRPCRRHERIRAGPSARRAAYYPHRDLRRRRRSGLGEFVPRTARPARRPDPVRRARLRRPLVPEILRLRPCGRRRARGEGLAPDHGPETNRPAFGAGVRAIGP
jgi:sulfite reductase (NADPH) flavoprotein alpha-component